MNVEREFKGNKLILTIDLSERHGPSASGKTIIIATTQGNMNLTSPDGLQFSVGLNVYTKNK